MFPEGHLGACLHGRGAAVAKALKAGPAGLVSADCKQTPQIFMHKPLPARKVK